METFSVLLTIFAGNSPVPGEFPAKRPVTQSSDVFFGLNRRLSKQSWGWWFEMLTRPLWRHCNVVGSSKFSATREQCGWEHLYCSPVFPHQSARSISCRASHVFFGYFPICFALTSPIFLLFTEDWDVITRKTCNDNSPLHVWSLLEKYRLHKPRSTSSSISGQRSTTAVGIKQVWEVV